MTQLEAHIIVYLVLLVIFIIALIVDILKNKGPSLLGFVMIIGWIIFTLIYGGIFWW